MLCVYDWQGRVVRVDTTTAAAYVTPDGMCQLGHSKEHRPDLPPGKIAMAVLDPLGLPLTTPVVAGHTADDPRYLPESANIRQIAGSRGLPYGGDWKRAAIGTRAEMVAHGDDSLCPLSAKQMPDADLKRRDGTCPATTVRRERVRVSAASEEAPLAHAVRRLGWRVAATKHTAEEVGLAQGVAA